MSGFVSFERDLDLHYHNLKWSLSLKLSLASVRSLWNYYPILYIDNNILQPLGDLIFTPLPWKVKMGNQPEMRLGIQHE